MSTKRKAPPADGDAKEVLEVKAAAHVPRDWPGFLFRKVDHKSLKEDFVLKPDRHKALFLDRLPSACDRDPRLVVTPRPAEEAAALIKVPACLCDQEG